MLIDKNLRACIRLAGRATANQSEVIMLKSLLTNTAFDMDFT